MFGAVILVAVVLVSGFVVFQIMRDKGQDVLSSDLQLTLRGRARRFDTVLDNAVDRAVTVATRPFLLRELAKRIKDPRNREASLALRRGLQSFLKRGFSALALQTENGSIVFSAGTFILHPALTIPLATRGDTKLEWHHGLVLQMKLRIERGSRPIGYLLAEAPLHGLDSVLRNLSTLAPSAELAVCGPKGTNMSCFPTRLHPAPVPSMSKRIHATLLPMAHALRGQTGVVRTRDYRDREVIAAYMPLGATGLGMVLKVDAADLYAPIWQTLPFVVPSLAALVLISLVLLHWLVRPLVRDVVTSEAEARRNQALLRGSEIRLRTLFDSVDDGIVVSDSLGKIEAFNPGAEKIFGYAASEAIGRNVSMLMPESEHRRHDGFINRYLNGHEPGLIGQGRELLGRRRNGEPVPLDLRLSEMYIEQRRLFVATMRDVTERKRNEAHILHMATHDALTGLPNRSLVLERAGQAFVRAERAECKVAILFLDLDGFKQVNDTHGHDAGDVVLIEVARRMRGVLRKEDILGRQGGDEFIVVLPAIANAESAKMVANKILETMRTPHPIETDEVRVGVSIGIGLYPDDGPSVTAVLKHADVAMYSVKRRGGWGISLE